MGIWTEFDWPRIETGGGRFVSAIMNFRVP